MGQHDYRYCTILGSCIKVQGRLLYVQRHSRLSHHSSIVATFQRRSGTNVQSNEYCKEQTEEQAGFNHFQLHTPYKDKQNCHSYVLPDDVLTKITKTIKKPSTSTNEVETSTCAASATLEVVEVENDAIDNEIFACLNL